MRSAVAKGIIWLDGVEPNWRGRIDWQRLDMGHVDNSILGQLNRWSFFNNRFSNEHGFDLIGATPPDYVLLTETWRVMANS